MIIDKRTSKPLSTESKQASKLYQDAIDLILGSQSGAGEALDKAIALDENFALALAARYFVANNEKSPDAESFKVRAEQLATELSDWESAHIKILFGLIEDTDAYLDRALAYIEMNPRDLFVISQVVGHYIFFGGAKKLDLAVDLLQSVEGEIGEDWAFLARLGFALSEAGERKRGRDMLEKSLEMNPASLYTIHGLAHALHDAGEAEHSARLLDHWLAKYGDAAKEGQMYGHVQWHLALAQRQVGKREEAVQRYQQYCAPATTTCGPILALADCGGFHLRDYLMTRETLPLSQDTSEHIDKVWPMLAHPFAALHIAGLYLSAGDIAGLSKCEAELATRAETSNREVSLQLVKALKAFAQGDYPKTAQILGMLNKEVRIGIGGSNVERELVELIEKQAA